MPERRIATVLMLDVVGSTHIAAQLGDARYRELSSRFNRYVRASLKRFGGKEEDHAGDGFFATFSDPDRAIRCAASIADNVRELGIEIRCGVHTGQTHDQGGKTHGIAVIIGARVMSLAGPGDVLVTSTTRELVTGGDVEFEDFSAHELKGVPGTWQIFAVTHLDGAERARPIGAAEAAQRRVAIHAGADSGRPRSAVLVGGVVALVVAIGAGAFVITRNDGTKTASARQPSGPRSQSLVQMDPTSGTILASIQAEAGHLPGISEPQTNHSLTVGQGAVWTVRSNISLFHLDPLHRDVRARVTFNIRGPFSLNVAEGSNAIWVAHSEGLIRVHPGTDEFEHVYRFPGGDLEGSGTADVVTGGGYVWLGNGIGELVRLHPTTGEHRFRSSLAPIDSMLFAHGSLWTGDTVGEVVTRYDPDTMKPVEAIPVPGGVDALVGGDRDIWVLSRTLGSLTQIDVATNSLGPVVPRLGAPTAVAAGLGAIWVGDADGVLLRVDEDTRAITPFPFGAEIRAIAVDNEERTLWIDVA